MFLGSLGVKAGKYFAGMDDFNVYIPTFDTQYQVYNDYSDGRKLTQSGDFSEVFEPGTSGSELLKQIQYTYLWSG